jgi:hypothetical protein
MSLWAKNILRDSVRLCRSLRETVIKLFKHGTHSNPSKTHKSRTSHIGINWTKELAEGGASSPLSDPSGNNVRVSAIDLVRTRDGSSETFQL